MLDVGRHPNINLMAYSDVEKVAGSAGDFTVTVRRKARYVEEDKCTGCGACTEKCPTVVLDAFNEGLGSRRAIYSWFAQGIPSTHTIDPDYCRQLKGKKCGVCQKTCQADAINFEQEDRILDLNVGAIIVASGYDVFDPSRIPEYNYQRIDNVVTSLELERLLSASGPTGGHLDRPSDLAIEAKIQELEKKAKKSRKAIEKFEKAHDQSSAEFYKAYQAGDYAKALQHYQDSYRLVPTADILFNIAKIYDTKLQDRQLAIDYYRKYKSHYWQDGHDNTIF